MPSTNSVSVIGAGAWGTALAGVAARAGREVVLFALSAAYSNKVVRFAGIDPERNVVRQSFAKRCFHGRDAALPRKLSGDSAARCPYRFHGSCLSNFLQRAQASSRAFLFASFAFGISPSRMKP